MSPYLIYGRRLILAAAVVVLIIFVIMVTMQRPKTQKYNILEQMGLENKDNLSSQVRTVPKTSKNVPQSTGSLTGNILETTHGHKNIIGDPFKTGSCNLTFNENSLGLNNSNGNPLETKYKYLTLNTTTIDNVKLGSSKSYQNFSSNNVEDAIFLSPNPFHKTIQKENVHKSTTTEAKNMTSYKENTISKKYPTDCRNLVLTEEESPAFNNTNTDRQNSTINMEKASTTVSNVTLPSSKPMMNVEPLKKDRLNISLNDDKALRPTNTKMLGNDILSRSKPMHEKLLRADRLNLTSHIAQNFTLNKANASTKTENVRKKSPPELNMNVMSSKTDLQNKDLNEKEMPGLNNTNMNFSTLNTTKASKPSRNINLESIKTESVNVEKIPKPNTINAELSMTIPQNLTANKEKARVNLEDILLASSKPPPGRTIFFLDSSFQLSASPYNMGTLKAYQACAVESAVLHNPNLEIFVLFACPTHRNESAPIIDALLYYKNVHFRELNLESYARDTPIADWLVKQGSRFRMFHMSELVRLISLYRFGGIYLDMDVMLLRSLENEPLNYAGAETKTSLGNAVLSLEPHGFGHEVAELLLRDFQENCGRRAWVQHGPMGLARVLTKVCGTKNVTLMVNDRHRCHGFKVFNVSAFYEVPWEQAHLFFEPQHANETLQRTKDSLLVHMWYHMITKWPLNIDSKAAYSQLAAQHCPRVFAAHFT